MQRITPSSRTRRGRTLAGSAVLAVSLLFGGAAAAQTIDDPEVGGETDQGSSDVGSQIGTPAPSGGSTGGDTSGGGSLALTGGDVTGIAVIGAAAAGAGGLLVLASRRRNEADATV